MKNFAAIVTKFSKPVVAIWFIILAIFAFFALQLPSKLQGDGFFVDGDHTYVTNELSETFDLPAKTIFVLFKDKSDDEITSIMEKLENMDAVHAVTSPVGNAALNKNGYAYGLLEFDNTITDYFPIIDDIREITEDEKGISITGEPVISKDINVASQKDLIKAEAIGLPIALIVLLLAFGSIVASLLPLIIGGATVVIALGILTLLSDYFNLSIFVMNIVPMLGLALSIDFALLFINRYREEREKHTVGESVQTAIQTAGRSIIFSALCVMIGLGAMVVINVEIFMNIALGGTIVVFLAVLTALTFLPATITLLGDRLNKGRIFRVKATASRWQKFAAFVMKRPVVIIFVAILLLCVAMVPIKDIALTIPSTESLPASYESRQTFDTLDETFGIGENTPVFLLAENDDTWDTTEGREKVFDIQQQLLDDPMVDRVTSMFTVANIESVEMWEMVNSNPQAPGALDEVAENFIQKDKMYMVAYLNTTGATSEAQDFVRNWMNKDLGVDFALSGQAKFNQEIFDEIANKVLIAIAIIIVSTFIILMIAFRSILIPLKAILMNILGLGATFGILVYIFQYGHFGIEAGTIVLIIPVLVFCLVFGLSMDYEVFLISRIQEEYIKGATNTKATIDGLVATSKIITSAALIMIVITGAFAFTDVMPVKQIGVGIAIAIAIDATIIRLMLVPSFMKLFGDWNWWLPFRKGR
ncbi:MMPL family transporter [Solibacillus daqui]|uniref:MMPL family transporter n=1 Tax=Solibacillus daqui TaxID=2912187 RepID=UPI002366F49A|nr:MMPL family transporter [Solibacillus daqui]